MIKKILISVGAVLIATGIFLPTIAAAASLNIGKTNANALNGYIDAQASASKLPAVSAGIVQGDKLVYTKNTGNTSPDTAFLLASLSKPITALAVMQLVDQKKVDLNAPIKTYIPWFEIGDGADSAKITVRQLLSQTSGLSTAAGQTALDFKPDTSLTTAIKGFERFPLSHAPGKQFEYSNANFMILGYLIEQQSGQSYNDYISQHIFAPLDMAHSYASPSSATRPGMAKGHTNWFGYKVAVTDKIAPALVPDGYVISTVNDMSHFLIAEMNDGVYNGQRVVSSEGLKLLQTTVAPMPQDYLPNNNGYALGWGTGTVNGQPIVSHDGQLRSYQTNMGILVNQKTAVIVMINQYDPLTHDGQIYAGILDGITKGTLPAINYSYYTVCGTFDLVVLVSVILMIVSFVKLRTWRQKYQKRWARRGRTAAIIISLGTDLLYALIVYLIAFYALGTIAGTVPLTLTLMLFALPDVTVWLLALMAFFVIRAMIKAGIIATTSSTGTAKVSTHTKAKNQ